MVHLVFFLQPPQDGDGVLHGRLAHQHRLKAPLQGGVLLDVLAVLVERGGADTAQAAAGERRFEHVGGVHRALGRAGAHHGVQLVDEENDLPLGALHLPEHRLEPVLEFAAILGAGDEGPHVERHQAAVLQGLGHVAGHDPLGQTLHDGGLAHPGLADQDRVVLGAAREHLHDPPDLLVPADDRVELAQPGQIGEVAAEFLQGLVFFLRVGVGDALGPADLLQRLEDRIPRDARPGTKSSPASPAFSSTMASRMCSMLTYSSFIWAASAKAASSTALVRGEMVGLPHARTTHLGQPFERTHDLGGESLGRRAELAQHRHGDALPVGKHDGQQVLRFDLRVAVPGRQGVGILNKFLRFYGESIKPHPSSSMHPQF